MKTIKLFLTILSLSSILSFAGPYMPSLGSAMTPPAIVYTLEKKNRLAVRNFKFYNGKLTPFEHDNDECILVTIGS